MKMFTKVMIAAGLTFGAMSVATAGTELVASDETVGSDICVIAASGNKINLRRAIEDARLTRTEVVENLTCNELPIVEFIEQYGENAMQMNQYITKGKYTSQLISRNAN